MLALACIFIICRKPDKIVYNIISYNDTDIIEQ